jgi:adenine phosphoribosyltransferase
LYLGHMIDAAELEAFVRDIPDFPTEGIVFKDITPLLADRRGLKDTIGALVEPWRGDPVDLVVGMEARGFALGPPVAMALDAGFVMARKEGKLPSSTISESYGLEYGTDVLEVHDDAMTENDQVLIIDDVLATGGTAAATARLVEGTGATVIGFGFLIELAILSGRERLNGYRVEAVMTVND